MLERQTHSAPAVVEEDTSRLTTSDYLSVHAGCMAANSPDSRQQSVGYFLTGTEGCLISQVLAEER